MASSNFLALYVFVYNNCKYLLILFWQKQINWINKTTTNLVFQLLTELQSSAEQKQAVAQPWDRAVHLK